MSAFNSATSACNVRRSETKAERSNPFSTPATTCAGNSVRSSRISRPSVSAAPVIQAAVDMVQVVALLGHRVGERIQAVALLGHLGGERIQATVDPVQAVVDAVQAAAQVAQADPNLSHLAA